MLGVNIILIRININKRSPKIHSNHEKVQTFNLKFVKKNYEWITIISEATKFSTYTSWDDHKINTTHCNGSELIIEEHYNTIYHTLCTNTSRHIQALSPLWDMPNYYYMYSLLFGSELIKPILYILSSFSGTQCGVESNRERASALALSHPFHCLSILWADFSHDSSSW